MQIKIRQLRALDTIVRVGSFVDAARTLHITPAALSLSIRELEDIVGFRVLERTTRRLALTDPGRGYLAHAQRILAELDNAERFARDVRAGHSLVRIATTQTVIATLLTLVLPEVQSAFPLIRLQPLDVAASDIKEALVDGRADIAIGVGLPDSDALESRPVFVSRWFAFMNAQHRLSRRRQLAWTDLQDEPLFMTQAANYFQLRANLGKERPLRNLQESTTASAGIAMAASGLGVAVFPAYVRLLADMLKVRSAPIVTPDFRHQLDIGVPRFPSTPAPIHAMRDAIGQALARTCGHLV